MLIRIEEANTSEGWLVWMDACYVKFRSYAEAEAFVKTLEDRVNAAHPLSISINRPVVELS
ncbi:hypothetical protein HP062_04825 [Pseudomonas sp. B14-6]|jgi:hypothetical protein|uniref:hypothetical protein n=1 Tax=Pseudomonas sp. B14-6 TaxID=2738843 RepID=UPI00155F1CD8|nr:hypothetical protein [Pseudomonas sp. B14-6]QKG64966.1 hypothetical protein HP062_04825 [Pseudomonas sp. B14-6]